MLLRNLPILVVGVVMILVLALPALAAPPEKCEVHKYPNCGVSSNHRANASGKGNFGQCHKTSFFTDEKPLGGNASSQYNPSSQSPGGADCREVVDRDGGQSASSINGPGACPPGTELTSEAQLNFHPEGAIARQDCVPIQ